MKEVISRLIVKTATFSFLSLIKDDTIKPVKRDINAKWLTLGQVGKFEELKRNKSEQVKDKIN